MKTKNRANWTIRSFDTEVREACTDYCLNVLGHRGNNLYIENLIKKDLTKNGYEFPN